jgi:hypothetical protein
MGHASHVPHLATPSLGGVTARLTRVVAWIEAAFRTVRDSAAPMRIGNGAAGSGTCRGHGGECRRGFG